MIVSPNIRRFSYIFMRITMVSYTRPSSHIDIKNENMTRDEYVTVTVPTAYKNLPPHPVRIWDKMSLIFTFISNDDNRIVIAKSLAPARQDITQPREYHSLPHALHPGIEDYPF